MISLSEGPENSRLGQSFWGWLADDKVFMPRYSCGPGWTETLVAEQKAANLAIAGAYVAIPFALAAIAWLAYKKRAVPAYWPLGLVSAMLFVWTCGATHVMDYLMFSKPMYRLDALIRVACAISSWSFIAWAFIASLYPRVIR